MKKIISLCLLSLLALSACKKDTLSPESENTQTSIDDFQSQVSGGSNARKGTSDDHFQIAIRKVENKENTYRLVLKIDSIYITEKGETKLIALPEDATVSAGLSIPNTEDPKASVVIFEKNELTFKKQNEKGYSVFVSDPFKSCEVVPVMSATCNFEYELVRVETEIQLGRRFGDFEVVEGWGDFIIVPPGKAISQNPEVVKTKTQGKWTHSSGVEFANTTIITIAGDPAQKINTLYYLPDLIRIPEGTSVKGIVVSLQAVEFKKLDFNPNTGVARFICSDFEAIYGNGKAPKEWTGKGTLYTKKENLSCKPEQLPKESCDPVWDVIGDSFKFTNNRGVVCGDGTSCPGCKGDDCRVAYRTNPTVAFTDPIYRYNPTPLKGSSTR